MKGSAQLGSEDRNFFDLVVRSIYMNPFSEERHRIYSEISTEYDKDLDMREFYLKQYAPIVNKHIAQLEQKGEAQLDLFKEEDRYLLAHVFLFQEYNQLVPDLDKIIMDQLDRRDSAVSVPFAEELISRLGLRGFSKEESLRYLAYFFQRRRAYYFISKSLIGDSPSMEKLRLALWNNVFTNDVAIYDRHLWNRMEDFSTLLLGETGTGKGSAAAAIGRSGFIPFDRKKGCFAHSFTETFISINLSEYSESLIESELFGHRKGAFTGAVDHHEGLFARSSAYGSLFLDEIGDIPIPVQIKLLRVLQERTFSPVGSHDIKRFEGRVIAASNRPISELRGGGRFRDDFFYRLCSDIIMVPTLRQRIEESPAELHQLVNLLVARLTGEESQKLTEMILDTLKRNLPPKYQWPGNVRELEQAIRRILLTQHYGGDIMVSKPDSEAQMLEEIKAGTLEARELLHNYCALLYKRFGTYEEVARRTGLDRRTVKKHLQET
jgi:transcriptional regulator with PAS, ATPase and Fis domain